MEGQEIKKSFAIKNPVFLKRNTISLERDAYRSNIYYLSFTYDALLDFDMNIYYECEKKFTNDLKNFNSQNCIIQGFDFGIFVPTGFFSEKTIRKIDVKNGQDVTFNDRSVFLDWEMFRANKSSSLENYTDIVIEFIPHLDNANSNKVAFYSLCKFYEENK